MSAYTGATPIPANVHMVKWLPQADLLGHKNTKLFITHCGANGQFEALYHGVPMVGFPAFAEQAYNSKRMEANGFGRALELMTFTADELYDAIVDVLETPSYRENIKLASQIYKDKPMRPLERASYWIEHLLKYGDKHLLSHALDMPWYSYVMLDILVFIVGLFLVFLGSVLCVCCYVKAKRQTTTKQKPRSKQKSH
jgi:glucuronosyltransferase